MIRKYQAWNWEEKVGFRFDKTEKPRRRWLLLVNKVKRRHYR